MRVVQLGNYLGGSFVVVSDGLAPTGTLSGDRVPAGSDEEAVVAASMGERP
jgi:hypothetical protein